MEIRYDLISDFLNQISIVHTDVPISVKESEEIIMPQWNNDSVIIGRYSFTLSLLEACFANKCKLFSKPLFYYFWACKNSILGNVQNASNCIRLLCKAVDRRHYWIYGYAEGLPTHLLLNFVLGHEAIHHCFAHNLEYKKAAMDEISFFINDTYKDAFHDNKEIRDLMKPSLNEFNKGNSVSVEECACDRESLKYIYNAFIKNANLNSESYCFIMNQLLNMASMLQYEVAMENASKYKLRIADLIKRSGPMKQYVKIHTQKELFRLASAAITLQELSENTDIEYNVAPAFNKAIKQKYKTMSMLWNFGLYNIGTSIETTSKERMIAEAENALAFAESNEAEVRSVMAKITDYLNSLLLGEELPK